MLEEPEVPCPALTASFALPSLFFFLGKLSWYKEGARALQEGHMSESHGMMLSINTHLGICPSHGIHLQNQVDLKNLQPFFVQRPVKLSQNLQLLE